MVKLTKTKDGGYQCHNWTVSPKKHGVYQALHKDGVYFIAFTINELKEKFIRFDQAVEMGDIPKGCSKTQERLDREHKETPIEVKILDQHSNTKRFLTNMIASRQIRIEAFLEKIQGKYPLEGVASAEYFVIAHTVIPEYINILAVEQDEDLPTIIREKRDQFRHDLDQNKIVQEYGTLFQFATQTASLRAHSDMVETLTALDLMYQELGI